MTDRAITDELFFTRAGLDPARTQAIVDDALAGADDGELYLEYRQSESLAFDDGRLRTASFNTAQGFGLRAVSGAAHTRGAETLHAHRNCGLAGHLRPHACPRPCARHTPGGRRPAAPHPHGVGRPAAVRLGRWVRSQRRPPHMAGGWRRL